MSACIPRPCCVVSRFSRRSSVHFTGRPRSIAAIAATIASDGGLPFVPNAPPTSGTITRIVSGERPRMWASWASGRWVSWAEHQTVRRPASRSSRATAPRASIGTAATRAMP